MELDQGKEVNENNLKAYGERGEMEGLRENRGSVDIQQVSRREGELTKRLVLMRNQKEGNWSQKTWVGVSALSRLLAVQSRATSLSLSFLICKMGTLPIMPTSGDFGELRFVKLFFKLERLISGSM